MDVNFRILGLDLALSAPSTCAEPIAFAYDAFRVDEVTSGAFVRWTDKAIETDHGTFDVTAGVPALDQLYPRFLERLYDGLRDHILAHAAVVADGERAILIAAPSGHGKSTLALELATRGWTLFSDDFAPIALRDSRVAPFPRAIGIVPGSKATPDVFASLAQRSDRRLFGKTLVAPQQAVATAKPSAAPLPISDVFLIEGSAARQRALNLTVPTQKLPSILAALNRIEAVSLTSQRPEGPLTELTIAIEDGASSSALTELSLDPNVLYSSLIWCAQPVWSDTPTCQSRSARETAQQLGREVLNRRPRGALLERYHGDVIELVLDLALALRQANCWSLKPGTPSASADTVEAAAGGRRC